MVKGFADKLYYFLTETKRTLLHMVDDLDKNESLRAQSLGPVFSAVEVTKEILCEWVDEFAQQFSALVSKVAENWQAARDAKIKE